MAAGSLRLILGRLSSILENEESVPGQVDVREIISKLQVIQASMTDLDRQKRTNETARTLVREITDVVHEVDDIIDDCIYNIIKHQKDGFKRLLKGRKYEDTFVAGIKKIKNDLTSIHERATRWSTNKNAESLKHSIKSSTIVADEQVVGIEKSRLDLIKWLKDSESCLTLNFVVGIGGIGKTTLVDKVYASVNNYFDFLGWVTVSQGYEIDEILRSMIRSNNNNTSKFVDIQDTSTLKLVEILRECLEKKRYLIVLDDVWDNKVWYDLKDAFPDNGYGSRVVITTRKKDLANIYYLGIFEIHVLHVLHVQPLQDNEAWELFCTRAFGHLNFSYCPAFFEESARAIVALCGGVPIAIKTFGKLMSEKWGIDEWKDVEHSRCKRLIEYVGYPKGS